MGPQHGWCARRRHHHLPALEPGGGGGRDHVRRPDGRRLPHLRADERRGRVLLGLQATAGDGTTTNRLSPVAVVGGLTFASLAAGDSHTCGLTTGGAAYCWGDNGPRPAGRRHHPRSLTSPVAVSGGLVFQAISAGCEHTCGLTTGGAAYCWGYNCYGQLGDGTRANGQSHQPGGGRRGPLVSGAQRCEARPHLRPHAGRGRLLLGQQQIRPAGRRHDATDSREPGGGPGGHVFQAVSAGGLRSPAGYRRAAPPTAGAQQLGPAGRRHHHQSPHSCGGADPVNLQT